jgi:hypothetical protein
LSYAASSVLGLLLSSVPGLLPADGERLLVRQLLGKFSLGVLSSFSQTAILAEV